MGKPKKGKKGRQEDEFGDDDIDVDPKAQATALEADDEVTKKTGASKGKKGKKKGKKDDWEDDVADEISALSLEPEEVNGNFEDSIQPKQRKKDKKKKKVYSDEDDDSEGEEISMASEKKGKKAGKPGLSAFQMLDIEEPDMSEEEKEDELSDPEPIKKQTSVEDDDFESNKHQKKGKKDKKKNKKEDEDIDAILAEIGDDSKDSKKTGKKKKKGVVEETEQQMPENTIESNTDKPVTTPSQGFEMIDIENMTQDEIAKMLGGDTDDEEEERRKKKKKDKKKKKKGEEKPDEEAAEDAGLETKDGDDVDEEEEDSTVKTAAQKKKEKRERQKQQKILEKQKQKEKGSKKEKEKVNEEKTDESAAAEASQGDGDPGVQGEDQDDDEEGSKKSKKDRRKKKGKEEKEEKKKKPATAQLKAMQEALAKLKEDEERLIQEEEERFRRQEEAKKAKEEKERLEKEKKEKEKQKKKERIDRLKQEGKYLTPKQKEAQRRAQQMLEAMRAQGMEVPDIGSKPDGEEKKPKKIIYQDKRKKKPWQQKPKEEIVSPSEETKQLSPETPGTPETEVKKIVEVKEEVEAEVKQSWEAEGDEIKDAWDAESDDEKETKDSEKVSQMEVKEEIPTEEDKEESSGESEQEESDEASEEETDSSEEESDSSDESDDGSTSAEKAKENAIARIQRRHEEAEAKRSIDRLRSPVVCVLGHVDTGKTKILDKLRRTNVQDGEAGGITQQIGATNVPVHTIHEQTKMCKEFAKKELKLPGLLIIDTPGHESFSNLRTRGSSLCDIAILVVDIMHGLEPQTIESLNLLKKGKTPFVVALNKIDRLFQWQSNPHNDVRNTINKQKPNTKIEFEERAQLVMVQFAEQGMNTALFYENKNPKEYISMVPTSAHSGDGMGNLIALICELSQTMLAKRVSFSTELQATVMEVKALPGLGTTIDVILVNGSVKEGETMIVAGTEGPICTTIRGLLMPQPLKELRVKNAYQKHKEVVAAQGVKIIAKDLDHALAGLPMYIADRQDEAEIYKEEIAGAIKDILAGIKVQERGVFVQASTIGSLEALLEFLRTSKIPYAGINIGPVHKKDIMRASVMLEHDSQYAVILAFDVKVEREAQDLADNLGVRIFCADIIYHLFDQFMAYRADLKRRKQEEYKFIAVFPCKLRILPQFIFNSRDPIVVGVVVDQGFIKEGTPICVPNKDFVDIGRITSIEHNHKSVDTAKKGQEVCIKIEPTPGEAPKMIGRHFEETDQLVSKITRQSIDAVKNYFREEMGKGDWQLIMELKKTFQIL